MNVSNGRVAVTCSILLLGIRNHVFLFLVGPTALEKEKFGLPKKKLSPLMRKYIRQPKLSTTNAEEVKIEPVPKKAKILPYME